MGQAVVVWDEVRWLCRSLRDGRSPLVRTTYSNNAPRSSTPILGSTIHNLLSLIMRSRTPAHSVASNTIVFRALCSSSPSADENLRDVEANPRIDVLPLAL